MLKDHTKKMFCESVNAIIIVYDVTNLESFIHARDYILDLKKNYKAILVLIGNKCDSTKKMVSFEQGKKLADEFNISFFETSAKLNYNILDSFDELTKSMISKYKNKENAIIQLDNKIIKKKNCIVFWQW